MAKPLRYPHKRLVSFDDDAIAALEAWRKTQSPIPSEQDAIRWLVSKALDSEAGKLNKSRAKKSP